jgi:shikimate kinase/3-dehydroquinate synthase
MLWASAPGGEYPVLVGRGLIDCGWWPLGSRRFVVSDRSVAPLYGDRLAPVAGSAEIEAGESAKTLANTEKVLRGLTREGMTREDHVVALGGGVVGDLGGLVAHLYQRGVPVVHVPTTLVSQVDSAYGGKVGVDLPEGKNYAGAFQQPAAVIADTEVLATLPAEELAAGFVEVLKTGLLAGGSLWERVRGIEQIVPAELDDVVFACARYKCAVVAADERDGGLRHVLNLGHTVGHAVEAASGYSRYRHGEAVGLGLLAALRLSEAPELAAEVEDVLRRHELPTALDREVGTDAVIEALQRDKKRTAEGVGFVLLSAPGEPREGQVLDPDRVRSAVEDLY